MNLADFYARGMVVPRDDSRALAWFILAAEQGRTWAATRRDALAAMMSANERAAAEQLADLIRAGYQLCTR